MKRKKAIRTKKLRKAVCLPVAAVLVSAPVIEAVDNPHLEPRQHEEEPRMTFDSPYSTTSAVTVSFPWFGLALESISGPLLRMRKK